MASSSEGEAEFGLELFTLGDEVRDGSTAKTQSVEVCKVGGRPFWLDPLHLPPAERLACPNCGDPTVLLCQLYAPLDDLARAFHRAVYVFACLRPACHDAALARPPFRVLRCQLPRKNDFYPSEAPSVDPRAWGPGLFSPRVPLCRVCGCRGDKSCVRCADANYCSKAHQAADWKRGGHKVACGAKSGDEAKQKPPAGVLVKEFVLESVEAEPEDYGDDDRDDDQDEIEDATGQNQEPSGDDGGLGDDGVADGLMKLLSSRSEGASDRAFQRFRGATSHTPDQVLRYWRGGRPLWIAPLETHVRPPDCESCGSRRTFEMQVMPQLLTNLGLDRRRMAKEKESGADAEVDWGVLAVYTCGQSCEAKSDGDIYVQEFLYRQNVS